MPKSLSHTKIPHLVEDLVSSSKDVESFSTFGAFIFDVGGFREEFSKELFFVEVSDKFALDTGNCLVDQEVHHSLGDLVFNVLADNVVVRLDQRLDQFSFELFLVADSRGVAKVRNLVEAITEVLLGLKLRLLGLRLELRRLLCG